MRIIKKLAEQMEDEVHGMSEYAKDALDLKYTDPEMSKMYYEMAKEEYKHLQRLHEQAEKKIVEARERGPEPPQKMLNKWDEKHRKLIEETADAKMYLEMYDK